METDHNSLKEKLRVFLNNNFDLNKRIKSFKKRKIYSLEIELTDACNLSCIYCYATKHKKTLFLDFNKAKDLIIEAKKYGIKKIVWLGGEPTLNPRWEKIIRYSKEQGISNELWSNGTTLLENAQEVKGSCDEFVLHLDSINYNVFNSIQENYLSSEIHNKILQGLDHLISIGFPKEKIRINIVLSKRILPALEDTMRYFYTTRANSFTLIPLFTTGKGAEIHKNLFLNSNDLKKAFKLRANIEDRPERLLTGTAEYDKWYQITTVYIDSKGDVFPYAGINLKVGNIYDSSLNRILDAHFHFLTFSDYINGKIKGKCGECKNLEFCFGTRANSFFTSRVFSESDKTCWLDKSDFSLKNKEPEEILRILGKKEKK